MVELGSIPDENQSVVEWWDVVGADEVFGWNGAISVLKPMGERQPIFEWVEFVGKGLTEYLVARQVGEEGGLGEAFLVGSWGQLESVKAKIEAGSAKYDFYRVRAEVWNGGKG